MSACLVFVCHLFYQKLLLMVMFIDCLTSYLVPLPVWQKHTGWPAGLYTLCHNICKVRPFSARNRATCQIWHFTLNVLQCRLQKWPKITQKTHTDFEWKLEEELHTRVKQIDNSSIQVSCAEKFSTTHNTDWQSAKWPYTVGTLHQKSIIIKLNGE